MIFEQSQSHDNQLNASIKDLEILWGAKAIADAIGVDVRKAFYLLEQGLIPGEKVGSQWTSTRARLRAHFGGGGTNG